jgi:RNA polymerase sigma factor (sigma-70 family)
MADTSVSLLERLRLSPDPASWKRLVDLYTPLIRGWLGRHGLQPSDSDDLVQDVFTAIVSELPHFQHNGQRGAFRSWLRVTTVNRLRNFWRARQARPLATGGSDLQSLLDELQDPDSGLSRLWDEEHDRHVARRALELIEHDFAPTTWQAFKAVVLEGRKEAVAAAECNMSVNAVFIAKSRVLARLRQEIAGLVD